MTGTRREIPFELARHAIEISEAGRRLTLDRSIWPNGRVFGIELEPLLKRRLGVGLNRLDRAFGLAHPAVDALVRVDDEHVLALVEAIHGADFDAVHVLALDAVFGDDVSHRARIIRPRVEA